MYIGLRRKNKKYASKGQFDFSRREFVKDLKIEERRVEGLPAPEDFLIEEHSRDVIMHWRAPEFEMFERDKKWYFWVIVLLVGIISYALYINSLVMAITFIMIGVVGYIYIHKKPRILNFMITEDGVVVGREIYDFRNLKSFWIFYEPEGVRVISLHTNSYLLPYVHIPIHDQDPVEIREILLGHIPEEKHEPGMLETMERLLRL